MMIWTLLSPPFLSAVVEWAEAAVTVYVTGLGDAITSSRGRIEQ